MKHIFGSRSSQTFAEFQEADIAGNYCKIVRTACRTQSMDEDAPIWKVSMDFPVCLQPDEAMALQGRFTDCNGGRWRMERQEIDIST